MAWLAALGLANILVSTPIFFAIYNNEAFSDYCHRKVKLAHIADIAMSVIVIAVSIML